MSGGANYGQTGGNMYGSQYGAGMDQPMNRSWGGQQPLTNLSQWGQTGGNMYGGDNGYSSGGLDPNAGMAGGNMGAPQPSTMDQTFSPRTGPTEGWDGGQDALLTGQYPGSAPPLDASGTASGGLGNPWAAAPTAPPPDSAYGASPWGAQSGGNMYDPMRRDLGAYGAMGKMGGGIGLDPNAGMAGGNMGDPSQIQRTGYGQTDPWGGRSGGNMYGAMGKKGGSVNPLSGMATTNPVGGLLGGEQAGGNPGSYQDYMNRRNAWINELRGYVMPPQRIGYGGDQGPYPPPAGSPAPPRGNPPPGTPRTPGSAPVDQKMGGGFGDYSGSQPTMQQFDQLFKEDPRLAYRLMIRNGPQAWNQNKSSILQNYFGGDENAYNNFLNSTENKPLSNQERWRLNDMIGLPSPDRMR